MNPFLPLGVAIPALLPLAMLPDPQLTYQAPRRPRLYGQSSAPSTPVMTEAGTMVASSAWCAPSEVEFDLDPE